MKTIWLLLFIVSVLLLIRSVSKMEKKHYTCIIVVVASNDYNNCREVWNKYMNKNENVKVFLVYGSNTSEGIVPTENDLIFDIKESYGNEGVINKTIKAFEYINENFTYDFLVRTNITTFWDFDQLLLKLNTLPKERLYYGQDDSKYCVSDCEHVKWVQGIDVIITPDVVNEICKGNILKDLPEDVAFGYFITNDLGINITDQEKNERVDVVNRVFKEDEYTGIPTHYRIKNSEQSSYDILLRLIYDIQ
jgi:hypothetical protein